MVDATYGGFWIRTLAYLTDASIIALALLALAVPAFFMGGPGMAVYGLLVAIGPIAYFAWLTASDRQTTFGKQLCGLKVQHAGSGERISLLRSIARELAKFVSAAVLMIGFLLAAFTQRKQGLHDTLASTVVVRDGQSRMVLAICVVLAGVLAPVVALVMFGTALAGLMMLLMGATMGELMGGAEVKPSKPVPVAEQKAPAAKPAAATEPEDVYRNFHEAALSGDLDELRKWGTKEKGDELARASAVERKITMGLMSKMMPKTYTVTRREISADGNKAILRLITGQPEKDKTDLGRGSAILLREGNAWKVDESIWGSGQPPALASQAAPVKPAAAEPPKPFAVEAPKPMAVEPPKPIAVEPLKPAATPVVTAAPRTPVPQPGAAPRRAEPTVPVLQQSKPPCVYKAVMTDEDIRNCR